MAGLVLPRLFNRHRLSQKYRRVVNDLNTLTISLGLSEPKRIDYDSDIDFVLAKEQFNANIEVIHILKDEYSEILFHLNDKDTTS